MATRLPGYLSNFKNNDTQSFKKAKKTYLAPSLPSYHLIKNNIDTIKKFKQRKAGYLANEQFLKLRYSIIKKVKKSYLATRSLILIDEPIKNCNKHKVATRLHLAARLPGYPFIKTLNSKKMKKPYMAPRLPGYQII